MRKDIAHFALLAVCMLLISCTPDKSEKFLGNWRYTDGIGHKSYLLIKKVEGKFLIYPDEFYVWDSDNGYTGKTIPADYDKENDKLIVSIGTDLQYNPVNKSIITQGRELFKVEGIE